MLLPAQTFLRCSVSCRSSCPVWLEIQALPCLEPLVYSAFYRVGKALCYVYTSGQVPLFYSTVTELGKPDKMHACQVGDTRHNAIAVINGHGEQQLYRRSAQGMGLTAICLDYRRCGALA